MSVPYNFDVRFRPEPDSEWQYLTLEGLNYPGSILDIYLYLDSDINITADREGFPAVEGSARGGNFRLYVFFDSLGEYRSQRFGHTGIHKVGRAEFLGLHSKDGSSDKSSDSVDSLTDGQILDQMSQVSLPVPVLEPGQEVVISAGLEGLSTDGDRVTRDPLIIVELSGGNSSDDSSSGDSSQNDVWLDTDGDGIPDTEVPSDLVPVDTDGDGTPDEWIEPAEVPVAPEVRELEPDTFNAQPWLPYAINVFSNKFPFDIFGNMQATSLPTECPVYTFLGYSHDLCPIRDLISILKYPAIVGYMIAAYHRL